MSASADRVAQLVELVVDALDVEGAVKVAEQEGVVTATIDGPELGLVIGRHGQTIDALQHLAQRTARDDGADGGRPLVVVDAGGYRARRREAVEVLADDAAERALSSGRSVALDAMAASERRIVHERLRDREDVETWSEGDEPHRHLVVGPVS